MNTYAIKIKNGIVVSAIVGTAEWASQNLGGQWLETDRKVSPGWTYTEDHGFRPPQPFPSWTWDNEWKPPVAAPDDGKLYAWNEENQLWVEIQQEPA